MEHNEIYLGVDMYRVAPLGSLKTWQHVGEPLGSQENCMKMLELGVFLEQHSS